MIGSGADVVQHGACAAAHVVRHKALHSETAPDCPKAGAAPNAPGLWPKDVGAAPNAGADAAPNAGLDAPKAPPPKAPLAPKPLLPKAGVDWAPKAADDCTPKAGVD